jgi:Type-F conjugative transfer system protein (TrbI_Ftype)
MLNSFFQRKPFLSFIHHRAWLGLGAAIGFMLLLCKLVPLHTQTLATVDVTGLVRQFVRSQANLNLPHETREQQVKAFGHQLETTLKAIAKERHVVLMPQEAVISGAVDLTPLVKARLNTGDSISDKTLW